MNVRWTQTRHFPKRICWVGLTECGRVYTLKLTEVKDDFALIELKRTDDGGSISDRRDGWAATLRLVDGLDDVKHDAVAWALRVILANP